MKLFLSLISLFFILSGTAFADHDELIARLIQVKQTVDRQAEFVNDSIVQKRPLTGAELNDINLAAEERLVLRDETYSYFSRQFYLVKHPIKKDFKITEDELGMLIQGLSVAVTLFDTSLYTYYKFHDNPKMRRILNERDSAYRREGNTFEKTIEGIFSFRNSRYLQRAIKIYNRFYIDEKMLNNDESIKTAHEIIQRSYLYNNFNNRKAGTVVHDTCLIIATRIKISAKAKYDFMVHMAGSVIYYGSKFFGNVVGSIQKRHGLLYKDDKFLANVGQNLQPMDVLLEKTPFRLTDNFIPGYWGHAAIYIGTREDLVDLGIWDNELVQKYAKEFQKGKYIVEALRDKVQMNTLEHFSDIDDFVLLRMRAPMSKKKLGEHILRTLSHVGKKYDFSFDVETGDTIVCSELHYRVFVDIHFNTTTYMGRSTISVDQVAEQGKSGMPFEPVVLYINGIEVKQEHIQSMFDALLLPMEQIQDLVEDVDSALA